MSFTNNYSHKSLNEGLKNFEFMEDSTSISRRNFGLKLKVTNSITLLDKQSQIFAHNFKSHGYINFYRVLRVEERLVINKLSNLFIYSYVKCLYNGLYYHRISEDSNLGLAFRGHDALMAVLKSPYNSGYKDNFMLSVHIDVGTSNYKKALLVRLFAKYPFLREFKKFSKDSFGTTPFFIEEYEAYMNYLNEDYYSRDHIQRGNENEQKENNKSIGRAGGLTYDRGKLSLVKVNSKESSSILAFNNSPLMNSFYSHDMKKLMFIQVGNGKPVENNPSLFFNKAVFLKATKEGNDDKNIKRLYSEFSVSELEHTLCSEVFTITGIKCQYLTASSDKKIKIPGISKVTQYLEELGSQLGQELLEIITNAIDEIDIEELFNQLLPDSVKSENQ